jgi:pimeloyl-ACP methyl ester carboxylesterase
VLGIDSPIDLVGLSMGGAISVVFADRHPESVRRLCLLDPAGLPWKQPATASLVKMPFLGELIMGLFGGKVVLSNLEGYFQGAAGYEAFAQKFRQQMQYQGFKRALLDSIRSGITTGAKDSYRRVGESDLPVMLIWGREDRVVPFELSREVRDLVPQAEFHAIDDAAHVPHFEQPEVVNPLLVDFLTR